MLSTWVLLFFAVACMKQEKDVFKSAEAEARKQGTAVVLQEGGKDEVMVGSSCLPPTNFIVVGNVTKPTGVFTRYAWTPPAGAGWSYQVKYYLGFPSVLMSTTVTSATQIDFPITGNPDIYIEVRTVCGDGSLTAPLTWQTIPGGTGGTGVIICDNLDNFTSTSGSYTVGGVTRNYTYSTSLLDLAANPSRLAVKNLTNAQGGITTQNITASPLYSGSTIIGYNFTVPNISGGNNTCTAIPEPNFNVTVSMPSTMMGYYVAYKKIGGSNWSYRENFGGGVTLPNLLKGTNYQFRILSQYTNRPTTDAYDPCSVSTLE